MINILPRRFRKTAIFLFFACLFLGAAHLLRAQTSGPATEALWRDIAEASIDSAAQRTVIPQHYRTVRLDKATLERTLASAPAEFTRHPSQNPIIHLPMPDGTMARFRFEHSPIVEAGLAAKYPGLEKTYRAQGIDDPSATGRFDWLPTGFHAMILSPKGTVMIDPYARGNSDDYISYMKRDTAHATHDFKCEVVEEGIIPDQSSSAAPDVMTGTQLRTYRLALANSYEYAVAVGNNTMSGAIAAKVLIMNRVNGVYERDLTMRMIMIANTDRITFAADNMNCGTLMNEPCTAANDPYTNSSASTMLGQNTTTLNSAIGTANYDIGHVFATTDGGVATLNGPCGSNKARGVTGLPNPTGDPFAIDYVAHEIGHQFGGNHTFNGCGTGQRSAGAAMEPGSGITIMAYAGLCGGQNLANNSIDTFHVRSIEEIVNFSQVGNGNTCAVATATGNSIPGVTGPGNFTIPKQTPFYLTAVATDSDGDTVTFDWQEYDLGPNATTIPNTDADGSARPIFRVYSPTTSGIRYFPSLPYVLNNANVPPSSTGPFMTGELLPAISRVMNFQVIARDNRSGSGAVNTATSTITIDGTATPFAVTAPNTGVSVPALSMMNVTWAASGPAANVKISLSTDGGVTFPHVLAASTPNSGSASVTLPDVSSSMARIKVEAVGNIYFDISDTNFTITPSATFALSSAVSRKTHGSAGTFNVTIPLAGSLGIENRTAGPEGSHTLVVTFNREITSGNAAVTNGSGAVSGSPVVSGSTMTVNLTGVTDAQVLTVTLQNVTDTSAQVLPDTTFNVGFLVGDVNGSGGVTSSDVGQVKSLSGQTVTSENFRSDINASGGISATDIGIVKSRSGAVLPTARSAKAAQ
jgi:hypothetical protein